MDLDKAIAAFRELVTVVKALRTPGTGCPWDLEQDHLSLRPFLIEEAYEVLDSIDRGDDREMREELGDLLLQVVLHAQVADDRGAFSITEVAQSIADKMVRRHPHVFAATQVSGSAEVVRNWEQIKALEMKEKGHSTDLAAAMARLPDELPALHRAQRLGEKAARAHVSDRTPAELLREVRSGLSTLDKELAAETRAEPTVAPSRVSPERRARLEQELGAALFALCQIARKLGISAEDSLRAFNRRFVQQGGECDV
jgi:MazG family protein